jgi:hypothetical protein
MPNCKLKVEAIDRIDKFRRNCFMRRSIYRGMYVMATGFIAFLIALPIFEKKGLDVTLIDDFSAVLFWFVGFILMFTKKYYRVGMFLAFFPILFILVALIA